MLNIISTVVVDSKAIPGVQFTLNKMSEGRRIKLRQRIAVPARRLVEVMRDLETERVSIEAFLEQKKLAFENKIDFKEEYDVSNASRLAEEKDQIENDEIKPAYLRWGLKSVTGLTIDGRPADAESIIENGTDEARALYQEIIEAIFEAAGLTVKQQGESAPPTTSAD